MVRAMSYRYAQGSRQLVPAGNAQTDDRGEYRVWGLNPGDYYVSATNRSLNVNAGPGGPVGPPFGGRGPLGVPPPGVETALAARGITPGAADVTPDDANDVTYAPTYYPGVSSPNDARAV